MSELTRRRFLESIGLGTGALLLSPVANLLVSEAMGQASQRRRFVLLLTSVMEHRSFDPAGLSAARTVGAMAPTTRFDWPGFLEPLASRRSQITLVDQLDNPIAGPTEHGLGYGALTCKNPKGAPERLAPPGGPSFEQVVADSLSAGAPLKSLLFGTSQTAISAGRDYEMNAFAASEDVGLPHATKASTLHRRLFGASNAPDRSDSAQLQPLLRDILRDDIRRLQSRLAAPERVRLEGYLSAIEDFDDRRGQRSTVSCESGREPNDGSATQQMRAMMDMATLALQCGLTHVVGIAVGTSNAHDDHLPIYDGTGRIPVHGYQTPNALQFNQKTEQMNAFHAELIDGMLNTLESTPEGAGTAADETVVLMTSARGLVWNSCHHSRPFRTPAILIGRSRGLRLDGRYLRFARGERSWADCLRTVAEGMGVCPGDFGTGGPGRLRGPIDELLSGATACG